MISFVDGALLPLVLQDLDHFGEVVSILLVNKVINIRYDVIVIVIQVPSQVFYHVG